MILGKNKKNSNDERNKLSLELEILAELRQSGSSFEPVFTLNVGEKILNVWFTGKVSGNRETIRRELLGLIDAAEEELHRLDNTPKALVGASD